MSCSNDVSKMTVPSAQEDLHDITPFISSSMSQSPDSPLDATDDARAIVRILQCSQCSLPLRQPSILPCGNQLCRSCIPESHARTNVSYPAMTPARTQGFICPFTGCEQEHAMDDCSLDVTLSKVVDIVQPLMELIASTNAAEPILLAEVDKWASAGITSLSGKEARSVTLPGGRLVATYSMVKSGNLAYDSEVAYPRPPSGTAAEKLRELDTIALNHLKEATRTELDCHVCYGLFLDPLTTSCGHTFCRKCLRRVLDHSTHCPICRRDTHMSPSLTPEDYPSNGRITALLDGLCQEALEIRRDQVLKDELHESAELDTPLFICTLAFPHMPTYLHIFEPRYRLMFRRAIEGNGMFGILLHNGRGTPQGELGVVPFYQYGTLLQIRSVELLPDGRSLIESVGVSRFKVLKHGVLDGYYVGKIERHDDISLAEEEAMEREEVSRAEPQVVPAGPTTANAPDTPSNPRQTAYASPPPSTTTLPTNMSKLDTYTTQALMDLCVAFIDRTRSMSEKWLTSRIRQAYGECPTDPALFPWWFASIVAAHEVEKYKLLSTRSVRERLKICARWVCRFEAHRYVSSTQGQAGVPLAQSGWPLASLIVDELAMARAAVAAENRAEAARQRREAMLAERREAMLAEAIGNQAVFRTASARRRSDVARGLMSSGRAAESDSQEGSSRGGSNGHGEEEADDNI